MTDTSKSFARETLDELWRFWAKTAREIAAKNTNLSAQLSAANARADQARDAALVEAADTLEAQALDADAQAKRFRGGSDTWADRTARSRALRNSASIILALRDKPAPAVTVHERPMTIGYDVSSGRDESVIVIRNPTEKFMEALRAITGGGDE